MVVDKNLIEQLRKQVQWNPLEVDNFKGNSCSKSTILRGNFCSKSTISRENSCSKSTILRGNSCSKSTIFRTPFCFFFLYIFYNGYSKPCAYGQQIIFGLEVLTLSNSTVCTHLADSAFSNTAFFTVCLRHIL